VNFNRANSLSISAWLALAFVFAVCHPCDRTLLGDDDFEHPPISYYDSQSRDPVALLLDRLKSGQQELKPDARGSYLSDLLKALNVPESSQCLVFSKTSLQIPHIGPRTPRALYFNDSVYVGMVVGSPVMELAAIDPQLGTVFYTLERENDSFQIIRDRGQCLSCHATTRTERVPGVLVRSIYSDRAGRPRSGASTYITDHRSPFEQRWGGWYVTGTHGSMRHLGNIFAVDRDDAQKVDRDAGANHESLPKSLPVSPYLRETSDIVALMVLEHQTRVHNLITRANYESRQATHLDKSMNEALGREPGFVSESTQRRVASVSEALLEGLLFANEYPLESPVKGTSGFAETFSARGPFDSKQRSLFQLDLNTRMFQHPCSYLILSDHFAGLPEPVTLYVRQRLANILKHGTPPPKGVNWTPEDRNALREMLEELKPGWLEIEDLSTESAS
jgi:hypothetical protein